MPNHVTNKIQFIGEQENIDKVLEIIKGEEDAIDFDKIIPMPKTLHLTSGGHDRESIQYAISKKTFDEAQKIKAALILKPCDYYGTYYNKVFGIRVFTLEELEKDAKEFEDYLKKDKKNVFDEIDYAGLGIETFEDLGNMYLHNIMNYGHDSWYDWRIEKWGTKWGAYDIYASDNEIEFDTAWSCPFGILDKLAEICKEFNVGFVGKWADEDCGHNVGTFRTENGLMYGEYVENESNEAYEIYIELKGETNCIGEDEDGNLVHFDCDNCPNQCF